eukprot:3710460-Alexandrium_andersonii.AAC.1
MLRHVGAPQLPTTTLAIRRRPPRVKQPDERLAPRPSATRLGQPPPRPRKVMVRSSTPGSSRWPPMSRPWSPSSQ